MLDDAHLREIQTALHLVKFSIDGCIYAYICVLRPYLRPCVKRKAFPVDVHDAAICLATIFAFPTCVRIHIVISLTLFEDANIREIYRSSRKQIGFAGARFWNLTKNPSINVRRNFAALFNGYKFEIWQRTEIFDIIEYEINVASPDNCFDVTCARARARAHWSACTYTRRIFRRAHYTELSGHRAWCISQRPSRGRTYSRPALRKSLRATDNDSFRSAVDGDHVNKHRQRLDALVFSPLSILAITIFCLSLWANESSEGKKRRVLSLPRKRYGRMALRETIRSLCVTARRTENALVVVNARYHFNRVFGEWLNSIRCQFDWKYITRRFAKCSTLRGVLCHARQTSPRTQVCRER